jgi:DNA polymerase-3 subunit delta'
MSGFQEVVGHEQIINHLKSAMKLNKVSHAYIFSGEKGSGKKMLANAFAQLLQCEGEGEKPCGVCRSCRQAENGNHPDIIRVIHEKPNTIGIDDIREQLVGDVQIKPYQSRYKVYIVPDAERMTVQAQNALLKTIEEPPSYAVILFLTTNASSFLPTILSRCVVLNMKPVPDEEVRKYLMEHVEVPDYQADIAVAFAQGNIGKAVKLATSEYFNEIKTAAIHILKHIPTMEMGEINSAVKAISEYKVDIQDYLDILAVWYRDVLYFKATRDADGIVFKDQLRFIQEQTSHGTYEGVEQILEALTKAKERLNANVNFDLTMELLFLTIKENLMQ